MSLFPLSCITSNTLNFFFWSLIKQTCIGLHKSVSICLGESWNLLNGAANKICEDFPRERIWSHPMLRDTMIHSSLLQDYTSRRLLQQDHANYMGIHTITKCRAANLTDSMLLRLWRRSIKVWYQTKGFFWSYFILNSVKIFGKASIYKILNIKI